MMNCRLALLVLLATLTPLVAQTRDGAGGTRPGSFGRGLDPRMPDGRSRTLVILKKDVKRSSEDMARVVDLATQLRDEIEKNEFHTVDLGSVRKAEEIIRLVRRVKARLSRSQ